MKLLVLIIASDEIPLYKQLQELWKLQWNTPNVDMYFLKCDPNLCEAIHEKHDTLWVKEKEEIFYGITRKTLKAFEYFLPKGYTFILRTNLSSVFRFDKLCAFLETTRRTNLYAGILGDGFVSGCGYVVSMDIVKSIVESQDSIWNANLKYDDVCMGKFIFSKFANSFLEIPRYNIEQPGQSIDYNHMHYRIKHIVDREIHDIAMRKRLLESWGITNATV